MAHRTNEDRLDAVLRSLANQYRRAVIACLQAESTPLVLEALVKCVNETLGDPSDDVTLVLLHHHLPRLEDAGIIDIDHESKIVRTDDQFDTASELLDAIHGTENCTD